MAVATRKGVYIVAGKRTPFGKFGGSLRDVLAEDLFATAAKAALHAGEVPPHVIDTVNIGQISPLSTNGMSTRHAALKAGVSRDKPVLAVQNLSGSAFNSIILSAQEILIGSARVSLAGGMETLSSSPLLIRNLRSGLPIGKTKEIEDMVSVCNFDTYCGLTLLQTADLLAGEYAITRNDLDEYALRSQRRYKMADEMGIFEAELAPVRIKMREKEVMLIKDEHPRPNTTIQRLSELPSIYRTGVVTAGNVCGFNDGASAVVLCDDESLITHALKPLSRIVGWSCVGVEPKMMGLGPVSAVKSLLTATQLKLEDIDLIEIHETSAPQVIACCRDLCVDESKLNLNGGAIAIGHPSGASGGRIIAHLTHELRRKGLKRGIATACIGGGQGIALLIESV